MSTELTSFTQDATGVSASLRTRDGRDYALRANYLIAADGHASRIREALGIGRSGHGFMRVVRSVLSDDLLAVGHSTLYEGSPEEGAYFGAPPWEKPLDYAAASPLSNAGKMNTPLMLFANDLDWDYQMTEFDQYFIALLRQGKEAVYVRSWGEGHGDTDPANVRESWRRMHDWYELHFNQSP